MLIESFHQAITRSRTARAAKTILLVIGALFVANTSAAAQQTRYALSRSATLDASSSRATTADGIQGRRLAVSVASASRSAASIRPIIFGVVLGTIAGAYVGHEIVGARQSCPTSPGSSCGNNQTLSTIGFAVSGALVGGVTGALITRSR